MELILGIIILSLAIMAMSIGGIFNRKPLSGSCGEDTNKCDDSNIESASI